jgi:uncharacterized membrane protein
MMNYVLTAIVAVVMLVDGLAHWVSPQIVVPLVPSFLPRGPVNWVSGVLDVVIGLAVLWPGSRARAGLAFAFLCCGHMPLHLWDYVRPDPVFAPPVAATAYAIGRILARLAQIRRRRDGWRDWPSSWFKLRYLTGLLH